ncbi:MAG: alkaline phosphatase D family protein [Crocinitomicaceae bacterium]|nr:alkaline phosphatase D family protein [Crocinitomicaceae bacterium]
MIFRILHIVLVFLFACHAGSLFPQQRIQLNGCTGPFYHGVASGDPLPDRVIIWTRITPEPSQMDEEIAVSWKVATDTAMVNIVQSGEVVTSASSDFTVKADVQGLSPGTFYFYEFQTGVFLSPRGRTKTAPVGDTTDSLRFAIVSCANFEAGYFNVYRSLLQRSDFDAVVVLGDYIYEYETGGYWTNPAVDRQWEPEHEIINVGDYRTRYSSYKLDEDLQRLHQQFPFIIIYDDHEFANNSWMHGAENHQPGTEGSWEERKAMAQQAFFEWLPVRPSNSGNPYQLYRNIKFGNLAEFMMLDTRIEGREEQSGTIGPTVSDPNRTLLGTEQFTWLSNKLDSSETRWKILGQQVMMAPLKIFGFGFSGDSWDGYPAERNRIYNQVLSHNITDVVVITGDIHSSWACDLPTVAYNGSTGEGSAGVEFITPSVTSPAFSFPLAAPAIQAANSHIKYCDLSHHGYIILDINKTRAQADWFNIITIDSPSPTYSYATSFFVNHLQRHLQQNNFSSGPRYSLFYTQAPECPRAQIPAAVISEEQELVIFSAFPNPANDRMTVQFYHANSGTLQFDIRDISGKLISSETIINVPSGVLKHTVSVHQLTGGSYVFSIAGAGNTRSFQFIKN